MSRSKVAPRKDVRPFRSRLPRELKKVLRHQAEVRDVDLRSRRDLHIRAALAGATRADRGRQGRRRLRRRVAAAGDPTLPAKGAPPLAEVAGKIGVSNPGGSPAGEEAAKVMADGRSSAKSSGKSSGRAGLAKAGRIGEHLRNDLQLVLGTIGRIGDLLRPVTETPELRMRAMII